MTFSRYSDECLFCDCYYLNCEGEAKEVMDEAGIECSLEQPMHSKEKCQFFQIDVTKMKRR